MQSLEDRLIQKAKNSEKLLRDKYAKEWRLTKSPEERELIWYKDQALSDLTKSMINSIRGEK